MYIEELEVAEESESCEEKKAVASGTKRVLVGAGARALFYPTLLYNVVRNKIQSDFRWWDKVDEFVLLGAVPFPAHVSCLKKVGVQGVVTLNEPYETLVPTSLYHAYGIDHLVIPTRDYCFAPSLSDICHAVEFIHENALAGRTTYVHCKAGRGRSTTVVICYLMQHKHMTPASAYEYVKSIRPRVLLASSQLRAVREYYYIKMRKGLIYDPMANLVFKAPRSATSEGVISFDDGSVVVITNSDLDGYESSLEPSTVGGEIWADLSVVCRFRVAGQAALARISCLWLRCHAHQKMSGEELRRESSCSITADRIGGVTVDIHVY